MEESTAQMNIKMATEKKGNEPKRLFFFILLVLPPQNDTSHLSTERAETSTTCYTKQVHNIPPFKKPKLFVLNFPYTCKKSTSPCLLHLEGQTYQRTRKYTTTSTVCLQQALNGTTTTAYVVLQRSKKLQTEESIILDKPRCTNWNYLLWCRHTTMMTPISS